MCVRHRLSGISTYGLNGLGKGDEHPAYAPLEYGTITFYVYTHTHTPV